jgi:ribosomal protein S18 acetylase RimI-like enzyme
MTTPVISSIIKAMLQSLKVTFLVLLGFGLPLHGAITVFGPDVIRWWKELLLIGLFFLIGTSLLTRKNYFSEGTLHLKNIIAHPITWAIVFLVWGIILVLINKDLHTALVAYRYLGLGFVATVLGYALWRTALYSAKNGYTQGVNLFHKFCTALLIGTVVSTLFGLWAKFLGGYQGLTGWYSATISSWVPGQTIPLYHQVGDFVRLQGASSGPVEYGHLALLGVWYVLFFKLKNSAQNNLFYGAVLGVLLFGIWHSGSRAAVLGALILGILVLWNAVKLKYKIVPVQWSADKAAALLLVVIVLVGMAKFTLSKAIVGETDLLSKNIVRISDSDHLTRPILAFNKALESPIIGNLGELGPAARAKNLAVNNNDQAPIAESVPFDVAAQMGFVGFLVWLLFFISYYSLASAPMRALLITFTPLMLLATIFDMAPLSISFFIILGLGLVLPSIKVATLKDHQAVLKLKRLAFKVYVEQVWGWKEAEQKQFVSQELAQGGIFLVHLDRQVRATYCLLESDDCTKVYSFYVHPEQQSLGLGSYLLKTVMPPSVLRLQVLKVNSSAKAFYESHGFNIEGEDEHHWHLSRLI